MCVKKSVLIKLKLETLSRVYASEGNASQHNGRREQEILYRLDQISKIGIATRKLLYWGGGGEDMNLKQMYWDHTPSILITILVQLEAASSRSAKPPVEEAQEALRFLPLPPCKRGFSHFHKLKGSCESLWYSQSFIFAGHFNNHYDL